VVAGLTDRNNEGGTQSTLLSGYKMVNISYNYTVVTNINIVEIESSSVWDTSCITTAYLCGQKLVQSSIKCPKLVKIQFLNPGISSFTHKIQLYKIANLFFLITFV